MSFRKKCINHTPYCWQHND